MEHIGMDVHKNQSQVCILTDDAELIEKRIRTDRARFAAVLGARRPRPQAGRNPLRDDARRDRIQRQALDGPRTRSVASPQSKAELVRKYG